MWKAVLWLVAGLESLLVISVDSWEKELDMYQGREISS